MENCTVCQGTGWQLFPMAGMSAARRCSCAALSHLLTLKERVRIPQRYESCSFENFVPFNASQARALGEARKFAERFPRSGPGLLLMGDAGVGKTHLAAAILNELVQRFQEDMLFVDFTDMAGYQSVAGGGQDCWGTLKSTSLLVLDNFGMAASGTEEQVVLLEDLLRFRHSRGKPIIFTCERIRFDDLFAGSLSRSASAVELFLRRLHPSLLYGLFDRIRILLISGQDFRKHGSHNVPLF
jgi:DNA replication protein DnaC